jgi:thiol-disulfide isomerase/thioredoxin
LRNLLIWATIVAVGGVVAARPGSAASGNKLEQWTGPAKPPLRLVDVDGRAHDLATHAGRIVIVHFFATWCEPCRAELVGLRQLAAKPPAELSILAIDVAEVPARVRRFLESTPVSFPVLTDVDRAATKAWAVIALPTTFVLDRSLVTRLFVEGEIDWSSPDTWTALEAITSTTPTFDNRTTKGEKQNDAE